MLMLGVLPTFLSLVKIAVELFGRFFGFFGGVVSGIVGGLARFARGFIGLFLAMPFTLAPGLLIVRTPARNQRERT